MWPSAMPDGFRENASPSPTGPKVAGLRKPSPEEMEELQKRGATSWADVPVFLDGDGVELEDKINEHGLKFLRMRSVKLSKVAAEEGSQLIEEIDDPEFMEKINARRAEQEARLNRMRFLDEEDSSEELKKVKKWGKSRMPDVWKRVTSWRGRSRNTDKDAGWQGFVALENPFAREKCRDRDGFRGRPFWFQGFQSYVWEENEEENRVQPVPIIPGSPADNYVPHPQYYRLAAVHRTGGVQELPWNTQAWLLLDQHTYLIAKPAYDLSPDLHAAMMKRVSLPQARFEQFSNVVSVAEPGELTERIDSAIERFADDHFFAARLKRRWKAILLKAQISFRFSHPEIEHPNPNSDAASLATPSPPPTLHTWEFPTTKVLEGADGDAAGSGNDDSSDLGDPETSGSSCFFELKPSAFAVPNALKYTPPHAGPYMQRHSASRDGGMPYGSSFKRHAMSTSPPPARIPPLMMPRGQRHPSSPPSSTLVPSPPAGAPSLKINRGLRGVVLPPGVTLKSESAASQAGRLPPATPPRAVASMLETANGAAMLSPRSKDSSSTPRTDFTTPRIHTPRLTVKTPRRLAPDTSFRRSVASSTLSVAPKTPRSPRIVDPNVTTGGTPVSQRSDWGNQKDFAFKVYDPKQSSPTGGLAPEDPPSFSPPNRRTFIACFADISKLKQRNLKEYPLTPKPPWLFGSI